MSDNRSAVPQKLEKLMLERFLFCFPSILSILLISAPFYVIPFLELEILTLRRSLYFFLSVIMGFAISLRQFRFNLLFFGCAVWTLGHVTSWLTQQESLELYLTRIFQCVFAFTFCVFISQYYYKINLSKTLINFKVEYFILPVLALIILPYINQDFVRYLITGFGGNRVNFSIALSQIIFIVCIIFIKQYNNPCGTRKINLTLIFLTALIIGVQVFSAGRIGLLVSVLIILYFSRQVSRHWWFLFFTLVATLVVILFFEYITPVRHAAGTLALTRGIETGSLVILKASGDWLTYFYVWLDNASSLRLSIFVSGLNKIELSHLMFGVGIGRFTGISSAGDIHQVHNVFLNHLGEIGIAGPVSLLLITLGWVTIKAKTDSERIAKFGCLMWSMIAMVQPELLLSQIGTSLIFWFCAGYLMRLPETSSS